MQDYRPSTLADITELSELLQWLRVELDKIQGALPGSIPILPITTVAPTKPRNGMIVYADGTSWNPGSGVGFYGYQNGSWTKL